MPKPAWRGRETTPQENTIGDFESRASRCTCCSMLSVRHYRCCKEARHTHAYLMCFPLIYMPLLLKSFPEILRKYEINVLSSPPTECQIAS